MRLIEFLQRPNTADTAPTLHYRRLPLEVLGGSYEVYRQACASRMFESMIVEAAIDRYAPSIEVFKKIDEFHGNSKQAFYPHAFKDLEWAMQTLRREDRIVWYMRWVKLYYIVKASETALPDGMENMQQATDFIMKERQKALNKSRKAHKLPDQKLITEAGKIVDNQAKELFAHFMSLNIPSINNTVFGPQDYPDLYTHFSRIEQEWNARKSQIINHHEDEQHEQMEKIVDFPDGSAWFNLNRHACSIEGDAMGHCGNHDGGGNLHNETVLSYRVPTNEDGQERGDDYEGEHWKPRLTFILDKETGMMGEMKARNNSKPKQELHPYIIKLLLHPMVKGIVGGGYKAENNFHLDDLGEAGKARILKEKPELGTLSDMIEGSGGEVTQPIINRLEGEMNQHGVEFIGVNDRYIEIERFENIGEFIEAHKNDLPKAHSTWKYVGEGDHYDYHGDSHSVSDKNTLAIDAFRKDPKKWKEIQSYMQETYPEEFDEDSGRDIEDEDDVLDVAQEQGEEWHDQLGWAIDEGHRIGAESEMHNTFNSWVREGAFENDYFYLLKDQNDYYDSPVTMVVKTKEFVSNLHHANYTIEDLGDYGGWSNAYDRMNDLDEPYYGYSDYDEDAAIEYFLDQVDIPEVPHLEVPDGGNATREKLEAFRKDVKEIANSSVVQNMIEKYKTVVVGLDITNGAITGNVHTWPGEFEDPKDAEDAFAGALKDLAVIANEHDVPFVVRQYNSDFISAQVQHLGYKVQGNGYLRFDPKVNEAIKLRGFDRGTGNGDPDAFIQDLHQAGKPHPFDRAITIINNAVGVNATKWNGEIHLSDIVVYGEAGEGHGTKALQFLKRLADKNNVKISGTAKAYSNNERHIQDTTRLVQWYTKNGFSVTGQPDEDGGVDIMYHPRRQH